MRNVAVVGAGLAGLTAAFRLAQAGLRPQVFERYPMPGGLARVIDIGGEPLEVFYHHLFTNDTAITALAGELGLGDEIEWLPSKMGIWTGGRLWDFGTPASLVGFRPLPWWDKIRFVVGTLRLQHSNDPMPFEDITAARWIQDHLGNEVWRTVWAPLLNQKFSEMSEEVAMVWLWRKIWLRGRSRSSSGMGERLGYMRGSFARIAEGLAKEIRRLGGVLHLADPVKRINSSEGRGFEIVTARGTVRADTVLAAVPIPDYLNIAGHIMQPAERDRLGALRATGALCTLLELKQSFMPYYWLNIADEAMPFGGLIEHTNYIDRSRYGGTHLLYISNYLFPDHPLFGANKQDIMDTYLPGLKRINPDFDTSWIDRLHHFRADYAQPVVTRGYREQIPSMKTPIDDLYLCTMAQIYPEDRGQNYAVQYGDRVAKMMLEDYRAG
jgi:protoporphyrinogen oxidase